MRNGIIIALCFTFAGMAILRPGFPRQPDRVYSSPIPTTLPATQPTPSSQPTTKPKSFVVTASREGLVGHRTSSGKVIQEGSIFVALPSRKALGKTVVVSWGKHSFEAPVWDVASVPTTPLMTIGTRQACPQQS